MKKQNAQIATDLLDICAIMAKDPEGAAVLGVWHCMEAVATVRPDSCVCLSAGVPMTVPDIAACFHFPVTLVEKTVDWLQKLGKLTLLNGLLQFTGSGRKEQETGRSPEEESRQLRKREQTRLRVARFREQKKELAKGGIKTQTLPCVTEHVTETVTENVTQPVTQEVTRCDHKANINNINNNINSLYADKLISHKPVTKYQRILDAWNKLPLRKFSGLVPLLQKKLDCLLQRYGEETIVKTINRIAGSAFLLGKKDGSTWTVTFGWLLEPGNFAKVLAGNYFDKKKDAGSFDRLPGDRCPFYLPREGAEPLTPEEETQAFQDLFIPTTPAQKKAARLLGLADGRCAA